MSFSEPSFSVVIPTFERLESLRAVVRALQTQIDPPEFEILVVDDGSKEKAASAMARELGATAASALEWAPSKVPIRVLRREHRGPAAARNAGVAVAVGQMIAFLGDDTLPEPGWLRAHADAHAAARRDRASSTLRRNGGAQVPTGRAVDAGDGSEAAAGVETVGGAQAVDAVVGLTQWHPRLRETAFLQYLNQEGKQFGYGLIDDPNNLPFTMFYSSNLSLEREVLLREPFDERFPSSAWEDVELGYRLAKQGGLRLRFVEKALVLHDHPTTLRSYCRRQELAGFLALQMARLHPELEAMVGLTAEGPAALGNRRAHQLRKLVACLLEPFPLALPKLWDAVLMRHFGVGLWRAWEEEQRPKAEIREKA